MNRIQLPKLNRLAVAAVLANIAFVALLASVLPSPLHVLLPLVALALPLLTAAAFEPSSKPISRQQPHSNDEVSVVRPIPGRVLAYRKSA